jgi:hypothetical protein
MIVRALSAFMLLWAQASAQQSARGKGAAMQGEQLIHMWLNVTDRASAEGYIPIRDFGSLPARVRGDTSLWSEHFLTPSANPQHRKSGVQFGVHLSTRDTPDLLRYEYPLEAWRLTIIESNNFMLIRAGGVLLNSPQPVLRKSIEAAAAAVLNMSDADHAWTFQFPDQIEDGAIFSTKPEADPLFLPQWTDRADGGFHKGVLFFLCYKKVLEIAGYEDIKRWFDADFRQKRQ